MRKGGLNYDDSLASKSWIVPSILVVTTLLSIAIWICLIFYVGPWGAYLGLVLLNLLRSKNADILEDIRKTGDLTDATAGKLKSAVDGYAKSFA